MELRACRKRDSVRTLSRRRCDGLSEPRQTDTTLAEMRRLGSWDCQLTCHGSETEEAPHAAPLFCYRRAGDRRPRYDASDSGGKSDLAGGNGLSPYVQIVSN
jgi:hypothetical protein